MLAGRAEARYGYLAAVNSTTLSDGVVLDLGGGSMQLTRVEGREAIDARSWPLGAVRMTERFMPEGGKAKRKQIKALREHVAARARGRRVAGRGRPAGRRSAARSATSPRRRSSRPGCRPTASRATASRATRWAS